MARTYIYLLFVFIEKVVIDTAWSASLLFFDTTDYY